MNYFDKFDEYRKSFSKQIKDLIFARAREFYGECLEKFPEMVFQESNISPCKKVLAKGLKVASEVGSPGHLCSTRDDTACWADVSAEAYNLITLVFCPRGLFLYETGPDGPIIYLNKEAPEELYLIFGKTILEALQSANLSFR